MIGTMSRTTPRNQGRPSGYSPKLAREILDRLASGEMLMGILRRKGMPGRASVYRWMKDRPDFRDNYARAREIGAHALAEEGLAILDASTPERAHMGQQPRQLSPLAGREAECPLREPPCRGTGRDQRRPGGGIRSREGNQVCRRPGPD